MWCVCFFLYLFLPLCLSLSLYYIPSAIAIYSFFKWSKQRNAKWPISVLRCLRLYVICCILNTNELILSHIPSAEGRGSNATAAVERSCSEGILPPDHAAACKGKKSRSPQNRYVRQGKRQVKRTQARKRQERRPGQCRNKFDTKSAMWCPSSQNTYLCSWRKTETRPKISFQKPQKARQRAHLARQFISKMHRRDCCPIAYPRNGRCQCRDHQDTVVHFTASFEKGKNERRNKSWLIYLKISFEVTPRKVSSTQTYKFLDIQVKYWFGPDPRDGGGKYIDSRASKKIIFTECIRDA